MSFTLCSWLRSVEGANNDSVNIAQALEFNSEVAHLFIVAYIVTVIALAIYSDGDVQVSFTQQVFV